jgi:hypothetical protein
MQKAKGYALLKRDFPQGFVQALCPRSFLKDLSLSNISGLDSYKDFAFQREGRFRRFCLEIYPQACELTTDFRERAYTGETPGKFEWFPV